MNLFERFLLEEQLPDNYEEVIFKWFKPLAEELHHVIRTKQKPYIIGINGCQGSGKSTLSRLLTHLLARIFNHPTVCFSLDDFYLTKQERLKLAADIHPLLVTRGVPGTHDMALLYDTLESLKSKPITQIPVFDKASDDRAPIEMSHRVQGNPEVIIIEGWCLGLPAESVASLEHPINELEANEDPDGEWRNYVNQALLSHYQRLNCMIDTLVMLQAPGFDCVLKWRKEQEQKLKAAYPDSTETFDDEALERFLQHFERLTIHGLTIVPQKAQVLFSLDEERTISELAFPKGLLR